MSSVFAVFDYFWTAQIGSSFLPSKELMTARFQLAQVKAARNDVVEGLSYALRAGPPPPRSRIRYVAALLEVDRYLISSGVLAEGRMALSELMTALLELDHGIVADFLKPAPTFNRAQESSLKWDARAHLAVAVDVLVSSGMSRSAAAVEVSRHSQALDDLCTRSSKSSATALATWHAQLVQGKVKNSSAVDTFARRASIIQDTCKWIGSNDPHHVACDLVAFVDRLWLRDKVGS